MADPISPPPLTTRQPEELPAYLSNGMMGLRVREMPLHNGVAVINGYSGEDPVKRIEAATYAPYPLGGDIRLGSTWMSELPTAARFQKQTYNFSNGELETRFDFTAEGIGAQITVLTFCSRTLPALVLQEVTVEVDAACTLGLRASADPTGIPGRFLARTVRTPGTGKIDVDGSLRWESLGQTSSCGVAYKTELLGVQDAKQAQPSYNEWDMHGPLITMYEFHAEPQHRYVMRQIAGMVPSTLHHAPDHQAMRLVYFGHQRGFNQLRAENQQAWADLWRGRVLLHGAERDWQAMADAAYFYLHTSLHPSSPSSTAPFGLAQWYNYNYFYGHVMWDLETFTLPTFLLTYPPAAHAVLQYRAERIPAARSNAKMNGYLGLQFPWQSSMTYGEESTPIPGANYEQHVTLDVAFAMAQYCYATDDAVFRRESAWPVLHGAAEWLSSRVTRTERGYELMGLIGPAENSGPVNNNAYTAMAGTVVLRAAQQCAEQLGYTPPPKWERIARGLVIPQDPSTHAILNWEGYSPDQPGAPTPSAAAGLYPIGYAADAATERATYQHFLQLAPKYIGKPMLSALYCVFAARLGDRKQALELLQKGYASTIRQPFSTPCQLPADKRPVDGPFFANMGGFLMDCLFGLPGVYLGPGDPQSWCRRPVVLPEGWDEIEVERIWVRNQPAHLRARQGDERARIEMTGEE